MNKHWWSETKKIVAIGRNYVAHAHELGNKAPKAPFWFIKPSTTLIPSNANSELFPGAKETHHEVELGIVIGQKMRNIKKEDTLNYVSGYCLALDMTDRDGQNNAKDAGKPWTQAKGWDTSCPVSDFIPKDKVADPGNLELWLSVNGVERQRDSTDLMIFGVAELLEAVSKVHTLEPWDILLTGTPKGVGSCKPGDVIKAGIEGFVEIEVSIVESTIV